ncbi:alpha-tocopherol transfer protein-like [Metopolophium dirhodum]|uniref:alpha-tocopherol transfer protein-like n=1 Tax=Metopolophium dirhodum TaxID=44670 RepID=UPI0029904B57|nr:alpha-tocopherol transfer protein-like [Metopolophium dirhodum]XP_060881509.1 alpha-tocopherol transfer protein-like [Metopolophium dirhodum]XP_060881510.1 alpha-tocopherol transfer protein-like [Metopolophium dirhodum]
MPEYHVIPNEEEVKRLKKEYGLTKDQITKDVATVRSWMLTQPHLPKFPESKNDEIDFWIEGFLRLTKNNLEKTKQGVESHFRLKTLFPQVYDVCDLPNYVESELFEYLTMVMMPKHTPDGLKIMYYNFNDTNSHLFRPIEIYKRMRLMLDIYQKKGIDFTGIHVLIDTRHITLSHISQFDLFQLKNLIKHAQKAYPLRLKHTHILFPPSFIDVAKNILKPFVSKKMFARLSFHKNLETLWEHIPRDVLPIEYGGYSGNVDIIREEWKTLILKNNDWFLSNVSYKSDESKRLKKKKSFSYDKLSFKTLILD